MIAQCRHWYYYYITVYKFRTKLSQIPLSKSLLLRPRPFCYSHTTTTREEEEEEKRRRYRTFFFAAEHTIGVPAAAEVERAMEVGLNLKATELCLGLPGGGGGDTDAVKINGKRGFSETIDLKLNLQSNEFAASDLKENMQNSSKEKAMLPPKDPIKPPAKAQVVGWPPVRAFRKNIVMSHQKSEAGGGGEESEKAACSGGAAFVKVSMDGAPYLRKVDLKMYKSYQELSDALAKMFSSFTMGNYGTQGMIDFMNERKLMDLLNSSEYVPSYEDKDGDWMLVGDVPWEMFVDSCKRLRIMKGSEAIGLAPRAMEKCKSRC